MDSAGEICSENKPLEFTGNWFIDAGILGFVNLMEGVYGWDLEKLKEMIAKEPEKIYYGYFPFGYLYKWISERNLKAKPKLIEELKRELEEKNFSTNKKLFDFVWNRFICDLFEDLWAEAKSKAGYENEPYNNKNRINKHKNNLKFLQKIEERKKIIEELEKHGDEIKKILEKRKKIKYEDLEKLIQFNDNGSISSDTKKLIDELKRVQVDLINLLKEEWKNNVINDSKFTKEESIFYRIPIDSGFYKNFLFFNNTKGNLEQKESFYNMICFDVDNEKVLKRIDKTINKLLPSEDEFLNINYTETSTEPIKNQLKYPFVYLICFVYAFVQYRNIGYVMFYSNDLKFCYFVNKRLRKYKERTERSEDPNIIFKVTWQQVVDLLVEHKSSWSLENMYIISYLKLDNQTQENVEYIGIPKLQATIILDDTIREKINRSIQFRSKKFERERYCWLLEEFLKRKTLYPMILNHIWLAINKEIKPSISTSLYALSVDANVKKLSTTSILFSDSFFKDRYRDLISQIKDDIRYIGMAKNAMNRLFRDENERKTLSYELFSALKHRDRNTFMNILLKNLNSKKIENKNSNEIVTLLNYNYLHLLEEEEIWENFALPLVIGILPGDKNE
ncbi:MAG: hypothetical protein QXS02_01410 [Candidatus Thermoplasmatota archaeon]